MTELDAEYLRKMEDVLAMYEKPYCAAEPVVCFDEKPILLHADVRPSLPMRPGRVARRDNEYKRCGTANVFCAVEPKAGRHFTFSISERSAAELAPVLGHLIRSYPCAQTIHLVVDNLNIHGRKTLTDYCGEEQGADWWHRLILHYTPKHGSWLNQAEIEISLFAWQCLGKRTIPSLFLLRSQARAWNRMVNRNKVTIDWRFTRTKTRQKFNYDKNSFIRLQT